jgi:hypothetical protein
VFLRRRVSLGGEAFMTPNLSSVPEPSLPATIVVRFA